MRRAAGVAISFAVAFGATPVARAAETGGGQGSSIGATVLIVLAALLFMGTFFGALFASRRRPRRPSIYDAIRERLEQERAGR